MASIEKNMMALLYDDCTSHNRGCETATELDMHHKIICLTGEVIVWLESTDLVTPQTSWVNKVFRSLWIKQLIRQLLQWSRFAVSLLRSESASLTRPIPSLPNAEALNNRELFQPNGWRRGSEAGVAVAWKTRNIKAFRVRRGGGVGGVSRGRHERSGGGWEGWRSGKKKVKARCDCPFISWYICMRISSSPPLSIRRPSDIWLTGSHQHQ